MNEKLSRSGFKELPIQSKSELMRSIAEQYELEFKSLWAFNRWGQSCTTGVFDKDGSEFVFVPGDKVTIGTELSEFTPDKSDSDELLSLLDEIEYHGDTVSFIKSNLVRPHTVQIAPMLVERRISEIGWQPTDFSDERLRQGKPSPLESFWQYENSDINRFVISKRAKFLKRGIDWQPYIYNDITYTGLLRGLAQSGFALPNPDEWAYLCGGGCGSLFAWGDGCSNLTLRHFDEPDSSGLYELDKPNFFGIIIGNDPYKRELVEADKLTTCGGDGGVNICGGVGRLLGYISCSPHYAPRTGDNDDIDNEFDYIRRIIRIS